MIKKLRIVWLALFIFQAGAGAAAAAAPPQLTAKSAIVMDARTGIVIYAKDAEAKRYPASTTKMMTLIVALENGDLNDMVTTSDNAARTEGSTLFLEAGEQVKLRDLLYGMMLVSGNDAAVAVAEHIAGSAPAFARMMTDKARAIGATNTHFVNPNGLPDENHYTTAHDLAKIAAYGYQNPLFAQIVGAREYSMPWPAKGQGQRRELYNENSMLWLYKGGDGVKTGYTTAAGRCLVSGAKRDGIQLVAVALDSERMWDDSIALLNYGFAAVKPLVMFNKGDVLKTVAVSDGKTRALPLAAAGDMDVPVINGDQAQFTLAVEAPGQVEAPVQEGQKIGRVKVLYKEKEVAAVDLVAAEKVEKRTFFGAVYQAFRWMLDSIRREFYR